MNPWKALAGFVLKLLAGLGAFFAIKQSGKTSQKLKQTEKSLKQAGEANEIDEDVARMSDADVHDSLLEDYRD